MAVPALEFEPEKPMEQRVARLESNVDHILSDVREIKAGVGRLDDKIDRVHADLTNKVDGVKDTLAKLSTSMESRFGELNSKMEKGFGDSNAKMERGFGDLNAKMEKGFGDAHRAIWVTRVWGLTVLGGVLGWALSILARFFKLI